MRINELYNIKELYGVSKGEKDMMNNKEIESNGVTLIALVVTIIALLILAGIVISLIVGNNGLFSRANKAAETDKIEGYKEQIELIKADIQLQNEGRLPRLSQLEEELRRQRWVNNIEVITDRGIEKLKVTSKEGYILYVTAEKTEYKGKGEVIDTSALDRKDVIDITIVKTTGNGKIVKISKKVKEDYYTIKYQINSKAANWEDIESGETVEVPYGGTIYAKLMYIAESGEIHELSIENTSPRIKASEMDGSNIQRKTEKTYEDLFDITWGSDGVGTIEYSIVGHLKFENKWYYSGQQKKELSELELGTYTVLCQVTSPSNKKEESSREISITTLAETEVMDESNNSVTAKAIYSEYDLAYFRDLVNEGKEELMKMNAKLMNNIDLDNVCSRFNGSWMPIGSFKPSNGLRIEEIAIYYAGIFDGNEKTIENIYVDDTNLYRQALIGSIYRNGIVKNLTITGDINAYNTSGGICGFIYNGKILNCINKVNVNGNTQIGGMCGKLAWGTISNCTNSAVITGKDYRIGGITGTNGGEGKTAIIEKSVSEGRIEGKERVGGICGGSDGTIQECYNNAEVKSTGAAPLTDGDTEAVAGFTGGIVGRNNGVVTKCMNTNTVTGVRAVIGGITGRNLGTVSYCCNKGNVTAERVNGGIVGNNRGKILYVYNIAEEIKSYSSIGNTGGISGNQNTNSNASIQYAYSKSKVTGVRYLGGIIGGWGEGTVKNVYNIGTINASTSENVGQVVGTSGKIATASGSTTEADMKTWEQTTITNRIGNFIKQINMLPILNITVNNKTF